MNRFLKVFSLIAFIAVFASCKKDDDVTVAPPRDFAVQDAADTDSIMKFLKTHYIDLNETTLEATFPEIVDGVTEPSIWDNTTYPLKNTTVQRNEIDYKIYYLNFRQGVGDAPSGVDDITVNYRGTLLDGTQFDYRPVVGGQNFSLNTVVAKGWQDILPFFQSGTYIEDTDGNPASFTDFGAGAMFLPSGLSYFNASPSTIVPAYSCMVFTFQLFDVTYTDIDADRILNKDEFEVNDKTGARIAVVFSDTDGDGIPNYADVDDDGDGFLTKDEIRKLNTDGTPSTTQYWTYEEMANPDGTAKPDFVCPSSIRTNYKLPLYMESTCRGGVKQQ